ncbi:MAG: FMN-binding protein [Actinomycetota bacterium]
MKRVLTALTLTIAGLAAVLGFKTREAPPIAEATASTTGETTATSPVASIASGPAAAAPTTMAALGAAPGYIRVEGPAIQTPFGPVQVTAVLSGTELADVVVLQLPSGDPHNDSINAFAAPQLREMALEAQSADIDVVSGATFTSLAYAESLQAALDAAGI